MNRRDGLTAESKDKETKIQKLPSSLFFLCGLTPGGVCKIYGEPFHLKLPNL